MEQSFDWLEIMKGEIAQREDANESQEDRRQEIAGLAKSLFDEIVDAALEQASAQAKKHDLAVERRDRDPEVEAVAFRRLIVRAEAESWLEVIAEPYSPVVTLRRQEADGQRVSEPFPLKDVDEELILSWAVKLLR